MASTSTLLHHILFLSTALFLGNTPVHAGAAGPCGATAGHITTDNNTFCLQNGQATVTGVPSGDAVVPAGFITTYILTRTNGLVIEQMGPSPNFTVTTVDVWRIHTLVYDPSTLDLAFVQFGSTSAYDLQYLLVQGGGEICASLDISGAPLKTGDCPPTCAAFASGMSIDTTTVCLVNGQATLTATTSGGSTVPPGFQEAYILTRTNGLIIEQVATTPSFTVSSVDVWRIHHLVYDPSTLDLGTITFGVTSAYDVQYLLVQGGGSICASLDISGAPVKSGLCMPNCTANAGVVSADQADLCLNKGMALLSATPDGSALVPAGYSVAYLLSEGSGMVIIATASTPEFTVTTAGMYVMHAFVYDPATFDMASLETGVTTIMDLNAQLLQGGGGICASLDLDGADFQVVDCSPSCLADAGSMNSETEVPCLGDDSALISAISYGDTLVPPGYVMGYWLSQGSGLVLLELGNAPVFTVADTGLYHIHAFVYDPTTWHISMVQLGETTGYDLNLTLTQAGGPICASLDLLGASIAVTACPPACTAGSDASISLCSNSMPVALFTLLGGDACPDGMWTTPDGNAFSGNFNPAIDAAGAYTYTVGSPFNTPSTATVVVNVVMAPDAGTSTALVLCATDSITDLLDALGTTSDPFGTWGTGGTSFNGQFDPATMGSGVYVYTVVGTPPCANATASVTVQVNEAPSAGTDGEVNACIDGPVVPLFPALNGTPDLGGSWSGPSEVANGVFNPSTMEAGNYVYTVLGSPPCSSESATLIVNVLECPNVEFMQPELGKTVAENDVVPISVGEVNSDHAIGIWPNPAKTTVRVNLGSAFLGTAQVELMDATGRAVQVTPIAREGNGLTLDVASLSPGVWTVRITGANGVRLGRFVRSAR